MGQSRAAQCHTSAVGPKAGRRKAKDLTPHCTIATNKEGRVTPSDPSVQRIISELDEGQPVDDLARLVIEELRTRYRRVLDELLMPLVRAAIGLNRRAKVRIAERKASAAHAETTMNAAREVHGYSPTRQRGGRGRQEREADPIAQFRHLFGEGFNAGPRWGFVKYEDATEEQHRGCIDFYRSRIAGYEAVIDLHLSLIEALHRSGAKRLRDIKVAKVA